MGSIIVLRLVILVIDYYWQFLFDCKILNIVRGRAHRTVLFCLFALIVHKRGIGINGHDRAM